MNAKNIIFDLNGVLFQENIQHPQRMIGIDEGIQLLSECAAHKAGHSLFVCSNIKSYYLEQIMKDFAPIMSLFKGIVTPQHVSAKKPQPEIFLYLLEQYGLAPEDSLLLDDHSANIEAVKLLGLDGIQVMSFDQVKQDLVRRGIL